MEHVCLLVRVSERTVCYAAGNGYLGSDVPSIGDEQREDVWAGEGSVRRDRLLLDDQPLRPRADTTAGGVYRPECGDEKVRTRCQGPKGAL